MPDRPPRLPPAALFVVRASRVLRWGEKAVWLELWMLDRGPEGAWISDRSLAAVLGLEEGTVKNYRFALRRRKLAMTVPRPGARQVGWVVQLPAVATPGAEERHVWGKRAQELALVLDGHIRTEDRHAGVAMIATPGLRLSQRGDGDDRNTEVALPSDSSTRGEGVRGRGSPLAPGANAPSNLMTGKEIVEHGVVASGDLDGAGECAHAPEQPSGESLTQAYRRHAGLGR